MKLMMASALTLALMSGAALAQSNTNNATSSGNSTSGTQTAAAQKIRTDLQSAGFKDVNVVAESFLVQAKTKDGDPVVMTIGPHGMTMLEAVAPNDNSSSKSASNSNSGNSSASSTNNK